MNSKHVGNEKMPERKVETCRKDVGFNEVVVTVNEAF